MSTILRAQLAALRETCRATMVILDAIQTELDRERVPPSPEGCQHPLEYRKNLGVMGSPTRWYCGACGATGNADTLTGTADRRSET